MVRAPFISPEDPIPATARPTIRVSEEGATPHNRDPNSNIARNVRKVYWSRFSTILRSIRGDTDFRAEICIDLAS